MAVIVPLQAGNITTVRTLVDNMARAISPVKVEFADVSGGVSYTEDMLKIRKNQVQDSLNAVLRKSGFIRRPGSTGGDVTFATNAQGLGIYKRFNGTETLLGMAAGKLYSIATNLETKTELFDSGSSGDAFFASYLDKGWVCDGTTNMKVEGSSAYQIGITPPTGVTATAAAGGTITDGTYTVYACYARKVSGSNVLYSIGQNLGSVVMGGSNNTINIANFSNSADAQVNNKVIFLLEASEGVGYFFHETDDNTTTSFSITSETNEDQDIIYSVVAAENALPSAFDHIHAFDYRIFGGEGANLHYSLRNESNVYDMERIFSSRKMPFKIEGIFHLKEHLYVNTAGGIYRLPYGSVTSEIDFVDRQRFYHMNTVRQWNDKIIGLTYDGIKLFDGEKFLDYDVSYDVRREIEKIYGSISGFKPCAEIRRTNIRTEYHLCYNDDNLSTASNNARLVLNLNSLEFLPKKEVVAPWEPWSNGANYMVADDSQNLYMLQKHATLPKIYKFNTNASVDNNIYLRDGKLGSSDSLVHLFVTTRAIYVSLDAKIAWQTARILVKQITRSTITVYIRETEVGKAVVTGGASGSLWAETPSDTDGFVWDVDSWSEDNFLRLKEKWPIDAYGYIAYFKIEQTADDINFAYLNFETEGVPDVTNYT